MNRMVRDGTSPSFASFPLIFLIGADEDLKVRKTVKKLVEEMNMPQFKGIKTHSLRRSMSQWMNNLYDSADCMEYTGHKSLTQFKKYASATPAKLKKLGSVVNGLNSNHTVYMGSRKMMSSMLE